MSERRKPTTRYRGEPPPKRRMSTPPPSAKPKAPSPKMEVDEPVPTKLKEGRHLPVVLEPPDVDPASGHLQGIQESGVLAASIEQSRQWWLAGGKFEKYWTKPSKKKNQLDLQNPAKESMAKLGPCSLIIEPHVFEITLYTVKEAPHAFLPPVPQPQSPANPYGGLSNSISSGKGTTFLHSAALSNGAKPSRIPSQQRNPPPQHVLPPFREGFAQFEPRGLVPTMPGHYPESPRAVIPLTTAPPAPPDGNSNSAPTSNESSTNTDPVIQMLAARAATDHNLKSLMKVVAQGIASADQLSAFQKHIDELNHIIQDQKAQLSTDSPSQAKVAEMTQQIPVQVRPVAPATVPPTLNAHHAVGVKTEPLSQYYSQPPQYLKPKGFATSRPDNNSVVFDFTSGNGDRYLIPKKSILEYLPGNTQVIVSFLFIQKGSAASSGRYKPNVEYYEPVTMRLSTHVPRTLESLARAVAPPDEVRKYMDDVMSRMTLAETVYLATQLPRAREESTGPIHEVPSTINQESLKAHYSPPNFLLPLHSSKNP